MYGLLHIVPISLDWRAPRGRPLLLLTRCWGQTRSGFVAGLLERIPNGKRALWVRTEVNHTHAGKSSTLLEIKQSLPYHQHFSQQNRDICELAQLLQK